MGRVCLLAGHGPDPTRPIPRTSLKLAFASFHSCCFYLQILLLDYCWHWLFNYFPCLENKFDIAKNSIIPKVGTCLQLTQIQFAWYLIEL